MISSYPIKFRRQLIPNGNRRASWHNYKSRCMYLITVNAASGIPPFSVISGEPGNHDYPPVAQRTEIGEIINKCISDIKIKYPHICILRRIIMPEHIHFVIFVKVAGVCSLGTIIRYFKGECTRRLAGYEGVRTTGFDDKLTPIFESGYHDRIVKKRGQLNRILHYVSDNPRRRLLRMANPTFHSRSFITNTDGLQFETYGNIQLFEDPDIEAVKISKSFTSEELRRKKLSWKTTIDNCGVLVSPFISQAEKRVRDWALTNGGRLIIIQENGFGQRFAPKGKLFDLCSEGRVLIIAPIKYTTKSITLTRSICEAMNKLASDIASRKLMI